MADAPQEAYTPKPTLQLASKVALTGAGVGLCYSALQNALGTHTHGAMGVLTRTGGTIGFFAAMGGAFAFTDAFVANERRTDDHLNKAAGGCAAGFLAGMRNRSLPAALTGCVVLGTVMGGIDYTGSLTGDKSISKEERRNKFFKHTPPPLIDSSSSD